MNLIKTHLFLPLVAAFMDLFVSLKAPARPAKRAHAQRDSALIFRSTTASLTATETSSTLDVDGVIATGLALVAVIPKQSAGDTITFIIDESTDGTTWETGNSHTLLFIASKTVTTTGIQKHVRRFSPQFANVRLRIVAAGTSPDYGAVGAWLEHGARWNHQKTNPTGQESWGS